MALIVLAIGLALWMPQANFRPLRTAELSALRSAPRTSRDAGRLARGHSVLSELELERAAAPA